MTYAAQDMNLNNSFNLKNLYALNLKS